MAEQRFLVCSHCGFHNAVTGLGKAMIVKIAKPKGATPKDILGEDHFDPYWRVANLFGSGKNFRPSETAALYMKAIDAGATDEGIFTQAARFTRLTEQKYLPQFSKWLEGGSFLPCNLPPPKPLTLAPEDPESRLAGRRRAE